MNADELAIAREAKRDDLRHDAIEEMQTEDEYNRHEGHEERLDLEGCWICRQTFDEDAAENAWMATAVKRVPFNPYAPLDPQAPDRSWYIDGDGYVKAPS